MRRWPPVEGVAARTGPSRRGAHNRLRKPSQEDTPEENVDKKKFKDIKNKILDENYRYLQGRFLAIRKAIGYFLGKKELARINSQYEEEMTRRILEAREH